MAGWKTAIRMLEQNQPWDVIMKELRRHYKTDCSLKTAITRTRSEYRRLYGEDKTQVRTPTSSMRACSRQTAENLKEKNKYPQHVNVDDILFACEEILREYKTAGKYELILALLFVSGRRTIEIVNGRSRFLPVANKKYAAVFHGQAKTRNPRPIRIPLLVPYNIFRSAFENLGRRQSYDIMNMTHRSITQRYQSGLRQFFIKRVPFNTLRRVHDLRGVYAMACFKILEENGLNPSLPALNWFVLNVLGDTRLANSLSYSTYKLSMNRHDIPLEEWKF